jgi:multisubunit Na+/H+ antiporter MnhG subunit
MIAALLTLTVLAVWFAQAGFARLATPLSRLHAVTFVYATAGASVTAVAFVADGPSVRAGKAAMILIVALVGGAATSHAIGRALWLRGSADPSRQSS